MSIAAIIITKNEENNIERCLASIHDVCTEIILVDSYSTDRTLDLASQYSKVRVFQRIFDNYIAQKNFANAQTECQYIFSLDADEFCDQIVQDFIRNRDYLNYDAVKFLRINYIAKRPIFHGLWKRDIKIRLWKKDKGVWAGSTPHEHLELLPPLKLFFCKGTIQHYAYASLEEMYTKAEKYARMFAENYHSKSRIALLLNMLINPLFKFLKGYIFLFGFLDGVDGFQIARISAIETFKKYLYAYQWKNNKLKL